MLLHVRYDEIGLKGRKRPWFEKLLRENVARQLGIPAGRVTRTGGRLTVDLPPEHDPDEALAALTRTFGVSSASVVRIVPQDLAAASAVAIELARAGLAAGKRTFKLETRRPDKRFPMGSHQVSAELGHAVLEAVPGLRVDVHAPELTIHCEVRDEGIALHADRVPGPGGVPVGVAGRGLALLSGGIDSPVGAWYALKRGLHTDCVYFHAFPYTGDRVLEKVLAIARTLSHWTPRPLDVLVASTTKIQDAIAAAAREELRIVLLRRAMYRIAAALAARSDYKALVTGEALGQVASQTPENLLCVEAVVPGTLVLRPLLGFDKVEVIARAQAIGSYETSILPYQDCCSLFAPRHPTTRATVVECEDAEARIGELSALERESLAGVETWRCVRGEAPARLEPPAGEDARATDRAAVDEPSDR